MGVGDMIKTVAVLFLAYWLGMGAQINIPAPGCLWVRHQQQKAVLYRCYDKAQTVVIGGPQTDALYKPAAGDIYILTSPAGVVARTSLVGRPQRLPVILR